MCPDYTTKSCRKCGEPKLLTSFTVDTRYKDGYYPWCAECRKLWRQARKERQRELYNAWAEKNRDRVHELSNQSYARHKDRIGPKRNAHLRNRWQNDPDYRKRKIIQAAEKNRRRDAVLHGAPNEHHTEQEWVDLCAKYDHRCLRCGKHKPLTRDHIVPVTHKGSDAIWNIQPLCRECNSIKNNRTIDYRLDWEDQSSQSNRC